MEHEFRVDLKPEKRIQLRVGVRDAEGRTSQSFGIYTSRAGGAPRDDIYIAGRSMGGSIKVSLHASGCRQVGNTETSPFAPPLGSGRSRHYDTWMEPVRHGENLFLEYALRLPTDHLRYSGERAGDDKVIWLRPAPPGSCVEVIVCTADQTPRLDMTFEPRTFPIAAAQLLDGRILILVGRLRPMGRLSNEPQLLEAIRSVMAQAGLAPEPTHRLLVGYTSDDDGLRGWIDYSVEQLLAEAERDAATQDRSSQVSD